MQIYKLDRDQRFLSQYGLGHNGAELEERSLLKPFLLDSYGEKKKLFSQDEMQTVLSGVSRRLHDRHTINRYLVGVLVLLGLLGTFWGLTQTVSAISVSMQGLSINGMASQDSFNQLKDSIQSPLAGMGIAFSSSILGLVCSLVLGFLDLLQSKGEKDFYNALEEKLVAKHSKIEPAGEGYGGVAYTLALLEQTAETINNMAEKFSKAEESRISSLNVTRKVLDAVALCAKHMEDNQKLFHEFEETNKKIENALLATSQNIEGIGHMVCKATEALKQSQDLQELRTTCEHLLEAVVSGQQNSVQEIRKEIRMIVKTLSSLAEPDEPSVSAVTAVI